MKINHFPNISLDISETKEKYLTEKNNIPIMKLANEDVAFELWISTLHFPLLLSISRVLIPAFVFFAC